MKNSKKGELTSKQLISVIILVLSFIVILILYASFAWNPEIDKGTCHESVVLRSSFNTGLFETSKIVPLKCRTEKICLTMSGEGCDEFGKGTQSNPVTKIRLSGDKEQARKEIIKTFANAMYDCHAILGEGKLNYMPREYGDRNYCLICARIALDKEAREEIKDIKRGELYKYLGETKTPDGTLYLEYLYPGWKNWRNAMTLFETMKQESDNEEFKKLNFEEWIINLDNDAGNVVVGQMASKGTVNSWISGGVVLVGVTAGVILTATGIGAPVGVVLIGGAITAGGISAGTVVWMTHPGGNYEYAAPAVFDYDLKTLQSMDCTNFEFAP